MLIPALRLKVFSFSRRARTRRVGRPRLVASHKPTPPKYRRVSSRTKGSRRHLRQLDLSDHPAANANQRGKANLRALDSITRPPLVRPDARTLLRASARRWAR